jgi:ATP-dependent RNA helicase DOB1
MSIGTEFVIELSSGEIHYLKEQECGVVWEGSKKKNPVIKMIFLSATLLSAMKFVEWICKLDVQPYHVIYIDFQPTPLQHYVFQSGNPDYISLSMGQRGHFLEGTVL